MLKDLIIRNRSVRGYDPDTKVTDEQLLEMIDCARLSASSINRQPLRYFLANDEKTVKILREETKMGRALPELNLPFPGTEPPAYVCICQDTNIAKSEFAFSRDVGIAAEVITLAAAEMGLGACMIGNFMPEKVQARLGLPDHLPVRLIVAVGISRETIELIEIGEGESTNYYRDEEGRHFVPKRRLEDIVINR